MIITFLGTGPAGRIPRPDCKWPVCKEAAKPRSKSARLQTSAFLEFPSLNVLIDTTQDFEKQSRLIGGKKIDFVFITHGHSDAVGGLLSFSKNYKRFGRPVVFAEEKTFEAAGKQIFLSGLNLKFLKPLQNYDFGDFTLIPFRVVHSFNPRFPALGFLFKIGNKKIAYASDFKKIPAESAKLIKNADLAILDGAAYEKPIPTHANFADILTLDEKSGFKKIYLTQIGIAWPPYEQAQKIVSAKAKNIFLAYDGLKIEF